MNDSAAWTEEIARYLLIGTVFTGAVIGVVKNNHIQVDFFYRFMPGPMARGMATLVDLLRIGFFGSATGCRRYQRTATACKVSTQRPMAAAANKRMEMTLIAWGPMKERDAIHRNSRES